MQNPTSAPSPVPSYEPILEVRFAVVIYGGVSLAIYINGVVQEMLRLVRATAPAANPGGKDPELSVREAQGSEKVYRKLGQLLGGPESSIHEIDERLRQGGMPPVRTRFVIDILSGTSAGGINAVFLAKALANDESLDDLQRVWVLEGDIDGLINDKRSVVEGLALQRPPQSLLNGRRMYLRLLEALDAMDEKRPTDRAALVEKLDLFCTATDLAGLPLPLALMDRIVAERRHRNTFHFRYSAFEESACDDFELADNPFLAYAARCTSAFPFAFEPMALSDIFPSVQASKAHRDKDYCDPGTKQWQRYYRDYIGSSNREQGLLPFAERAFGDGGYLDNKPFSYAIETTLERHADLLVDRKLVYVEPNPEKMGPASTVRPDAIENSLAALISLPRYETIRQDLEAVINHNIQIERVNRVVRTLENDLDAPASGQEPKKWLNQSRNDTREKYGPGYLAYQRLKLSAVTDELARFVVRAFEIDAKGAYATAIRHLAGEWRASEFRREAEQRQFLLDFDVTYRLRRLRHVKKHINTLYTEALKSPGSEPEYLAELGRIRTRLGAPHRRLQGLRERTFHQEDLLRGEPALKVEELELVLQPPLSPATWKGIERYPTACSTEEEGIRARAAYVVHGLARKTTLRNIASTLKAAFEPRFREESKQVQDAFAADSALGPGATRARDDVRLRYDGFEAYDSVTFPILFGVELGEGEAIDVHRISPDDATARQSQALEGRHKLRGQALGAFGAFLDETWRKNDILWGRLDGAERLIGILLPGHANETQRLRTRLVDEAHAEIVNEYLGMSRTQDFKVRLREYLTTEVRSDPEPSLLARAAARSTTVTGQLLEDIADKRRWSKAPFSQLALFGRLAWGLVEVSVPRTLWELMFSYWLQLLLVFTLLMLALGSFLASASLLRTGLRVTIVLGVVYVARALLRRYLNRQTLLSNAARVALSMALTAGLAVILVNGAAIMTGLEAAWRWAAGRASVVGHVDTQNSIAHWLSSTTRAALVVTILTGIWTGWLGSRVRAPAGGPRRPALRMQFARSWSDVGRAVGNFGHSARSELRAALQADFLFIGGYTLLFLAFGASIAIGGNPHGWFVSAAGVLAGVFDVAENRAVLTLVARPLPSATPAPPFAPSPFPRAVLKWLSAVLAVMLAIGLAFLQ